MHETDHLDRMLESSLSNYGEPDSGLGERILARVASEKRPHQLVPRWRSRFVLWAALPAAACLLLTLLLLKYPRPTDMHPSGKLPQTASTNSGSKAPVVVNVTPIAPKTTPKTTSRAKDRNSVEIAESAARPKQDIFPIPQPLSPEEQALYRIATQVPEQELQAVLAAQKNDDAPLSVAALEIQPLAMPDPGNN